MTISFTVPGVPLGKQRPRHNRYTNATYTPEKTKLREEEIAVEYKRHVGGCRFPTDSYLELSIVALMPIPKRSSKAMREKMIMHNVLPTTKPDCDNILKLVADALNGVAYDDDKQIVKMTVTKLYSERPATVIIVKDYEK